MARRRRYPITIGAQLLTSPKCLIVRINSSASSRDSWSATAAISASSLQLSLLARIMAVGTVPWFGPPFEVRLLGRWRQHLCDLLQ